MFRNNKPVKNLNKFQKFVRLVRNAIILFFVGSVTWVLVARFVPVFVTPLMIIRSVEAIKDGKTPKNSKKWVPIEQISPNLVQAVVASEDNLFLEHNGFSIEDIKKALESNRKVKEGKSKKRIKGGSTISQQTAKNVFLWNGRNYVRKGLEAYFTVLIEFLWTKERIMEVYLNVIEMGDGIYGAEAAAQEYFGKSAESLSKSQAALIAVCLPNPRKYSVVNPGPYVQKRRTQIIRVMGQLPRVDFEKEKESKSKKKK